MFDRSTIEALQEASAIANAAQAIGEAISAEPGLVALPSTYQMHDLEHVLPLRRRPRGVMSTCSIVDFGAYVTAHASPGATVFVKPISMAATAVLNLGSPAAPGHADDIAELCAESTAAYTALTKIANGVAFGQRAVAEFLEDWEPNISCANGDGPINQAQAIAAVRRVTIEGMRRLETTTSSLSESRSAFEQVTASSSGVPFPTHIEFRCTPYHGLKERTFSIRVGVRADEKSPGLTMRIVTPEQHAEEMAEELAAIVRSTVGIPVLIGAYSASR